MGGGDRATPGRRVWPWRALRFAFLRAGLDRDWQDPVTSRARQRGQAAARVRARTDRGRVLRCRLQPDAGLGTAPAGRRLGRCAGRSGPGLGCGRDRGVRAGLLRQPVRLDGTVFEHYGIQLTLSAYVRRPGRMASRRLPAKITPAAMASRAGVIWQPDGRPNGTQCRAQPGAGRPGRHDPDRRCRDRCEHVSVLFGLATAQVLIRPPRHAGPGRSGFHGLISSIPVPEKSSVLRVASVASAVRQIAAIWASATPIGRPSVSLPQTISAYREAQARRRAGSGPGARRRATRATAAASSLLRRLAGIRATP